MKSHLPLLLLLAAPSLHAQALLDPALHLLLSTPLPMATQQIDGMLSSDINVYIQFDPEETDWQALEALGTHIGTITSLSSSTQPSSSRLYPHSFATLRIAKDQLPALAQLPGISYIQASQPVQTMLDMARKDIRADEAYASLLIPDSSLPFTGRGVIIGQVDAGLDYKHNAFKTPEGELRISRVWEQGTNPATTSIHGVHSPEAFGYGTEFDTPELILRSGGDSEKGSHGTHVMGIAAGSDPYLDGQFRGLAPEAELVMVAVPEDGVDNAQVSDAIQYIFDYADQQHKPCVINLSLGSHRGPHDGTSPFDQMVDALQGPGRLIVGAVGNYGGDKFHLARTYTEGNEPEPFQTIVSHTFDAEHPIGIIDLWADPTLPLAIELFDYGSFNGAETEVHTFLLPDQLDGQTAEFSLGRNVTGTIQLNGELNPLNGKQHLLLTSLITNVRSNHFVGLRIIPQAGGHGQIDLWADNAKLRFDAEREGFVTPTTESTVTELGGTAQRILSVGAYTTRDAFFIEGDPDLHPVGMFLNELCDFSGFGPTADGRQKPELCAPGSFIVSSVSGIDRSGTIYLHSHYTDAKGHPQRYGYLQGTSMSAPMVTGTVALWLQAYPELTPEQLKEIVAQNSRLDAFTLDPRYWGAGKLDVLAGLEQCIELNGGSAIQTIEMPYSGSSQIFDLQGRPVSQPNQGIFLIQEGGKMRKVSLH